MKFYNSHRTGRFFIKTSTVAKQKIRPGIKPAIWKSFFLVALCLFSWVIIDVTPYYQANQAFMAKNKTQIEQFKKELNSSLTLLGRCQNAGYDKTTGMEAFTPERRNCILKALSQTNTADSFGIFSLEARLWLEKNKDDKEVREASLAAIDRSWSNLAHAGQLHDQETQLLKIRDQSFFLKLYDGVDHYHVKSYADTFTPILAQDEFAVLFPGLIQSQHPSYPLSTAFSSYLPPGTILSLILFWR